MGGPTISWGNHRVNELHLVWARDGMHEPMGDGRWAMGDAQATGCLYERGRAFMEAAKPWK